MNLLLPIAFFAISLALADETTPIVNMFLSVETTKSDIKASSSELQAEKGIENSTKVDSTVSEEIRVLNDEPIVAGQPAVLATDNIIAIPALINLATENVIVIEEKTTPTAGRIPALDIENSVVEIANPAIEVTIPAIGPIFSGEETIIPATDAKTEAAKEISEAEMVEKDLEPKDVGAESAYTDVESLDATEEQISDDETFVWNSEDAHEKADTAMELMKCHYVDLEEETTLKEEPKSLRERETNHSIIEMENPATDTHNLTMISTTPAPFIFATEKITPTSETTSFVDVITNPAAVQTSLAVEHNSAVEMTVAAVEPAVSVTLEAEQASSSERPAVPFTWPALPYRAETTETAAPTTEHAISSVEPATSTIEVVTPIAEPATTTLKPTHHLEHPSASITDPASSSEETTIPAVEPAIPSAKPATPESATPATEPATPATAPFSPTPEPPTSATTPITTVDPAPTTTQPTTSTAGSIIPAAESATETTFSVSEPSTPAPGPATSTAKPTTSNENPTTLATEPALPNAGPTIPVADSTTHSPEPATSNAEPTSSTTHPATLASETAPPTAAPTIPIAEVTTPTEESTVHTAEPRTSAEETAIHTAIESISTAIKPTTNYKIEPSILDLERTPDTTVSIPATDQTIRETTTGSTHTVALSSDITISHLEQMHSTTEKGPWFTQPITVVADTIPPTEWTTSAKLSDPTTHMVHLVTELTTVPKEMFLFVRTTAHVEAKTTPHAETPILVVNPTTSTVEPTVNAAAGFVAGFKTLPAIPSAPSMVRSTQPTRKMIPNPSKVSSLARAFRTAPKADFETAKVFDTLLSKITNRAHQMENLRNDLKHSTKKQLEKYRESWVVFKFYLDSFLIGSKSDLMPAAHAGFTLSTPEEANRNREMFMDFVTELHRTEGFRPDAVLKYWEQLKNLLDSYQGIDAETDKKMNSVSVEALSQSHAKYPSPAIIAVGKTQISTVQLHGDSETKNNTVDTKFARIAYELQRSTSLKLSQFKENWIVFKLYLDSLKSNSTSPAVNYHFLFSNEKEQKYMHDIFYGFVQDLRRSPGFPLEKLMQSWHVLNEYLNSYKGADAKNVITSADPAGEHKSIPAHSENASSSTEDQAFQKSLAKEIEKLFPLE